MPSQPSDKTLARYYDKGHSLRETGERYGVSHEKVRKACIREGVEIRSQQEALDAQSEYPREKPCEICGGTIVANNHDEFRRRTCSTECRNALYRDTRRAATAS